jgi:hypothetical protein
LLGGGLENRCIVLRNSSLNGSPNPSPLDQFLVWRVSALNPKLSKVVNPLYLFQVVYRGVLELGRCKNRPRITSVLSVNST